MPRFKPCVCWALASAWAASEETPSSSSSAPAVQEGDLNEPASNSSQNSLASLMVTTDDDLPFSVPEHADIESRTTLVSLGRVPEAFACGGGDAAGLATEHWNVAARRVDFVWSPESDSLNDVADLFGFGNQEQDPGIAISRAHVEVIDQVANDAGPLLHVSLDPPDPYLQVTEMTTPWFHVYYDCRRDGKAEVRLRFHISPRKSEAPSAGDRNVCLQWIKECRRGFKHIMITHGESSVFLRGELQEEWKQQMQEQGTYSHTTSFQLYADGVERLKQPRAFSNQKLLQKVEVRGPSLFDDALELSQEPATVTLIYTCAYDGFADVTLLLEKETIPPGEPGETLEIRLRKHCSFAEYKHLQVFIRSETYQNKTEAVANGLVLPGFLGPCSKIGDRQLCSPEGPHLLVPEGDVRSALELIVAQDGADEPPQFQPVPDLSFNRKVMSVALTMPATLSNKKQTVTRPRTMTVKYTCFHKGVSLVMVTLHVLAHKPIDIVWRKACEEPLPHQSRALTAPQALAIAVVVLALVAVVACVLFAASSMEEEGKPNKREYAKAPVDSEATADVLLELPSRTKVGRPLPPEVVYH